MSAPDSALTPAAGSGRSHAPEGLYEQIDKDMNQRIGASMGFEALLAAKPYPMDERSLAGFRSRYALIKSFQEQTLALFKASLKGECDPDIAQLVAGELPTSFGADYHRQLTEQQHRTPVFFRTDEAAPGKLAEIQCPGSGWCLAEQIRELYNNNENVFGTAQHFRDPLASVFAKSLRACLGKDPLIHHLVDNASRPHGMRYFIQRTREQGVKYFSYDREASAQDCNFVRSHDYVSVLHHNFFSERMEGCNAGDVRFDLPPSALFDGKMIMAWPFWERTRSWYSDEVRSLFPYTNLIEPGGIALKDGQRLSIDEFCNLPAQDRNYYLKYAGTDIALNWGSRAVYLANASSRVQTRKLLERIAEDNQRQRFWIIQEAIRHKEQAAAHARDGTITNTEAYSKWSGFYGPDGLMGILVFQKRFHKVHGSPDTIMSIVY